MISFEVVIRCFCPQALRLQLEESESTVNRHEASKALLKPAVPTATAKMQLPLQFYLHLQRTETRGSTSSL